MYPIKAIKNVNTRNGLSKVVTLEDTDSTFTDVFLPPRFNDTQFDLLNYIHYLVYHGKKPMRNGAEFHDIEFQVFPQNILQTTLHHTPLRKLL